MRRREENRDGDDEGERVTGGKIRSGMKKKAEARERG